MSDQELYDATFEQIEKVTGHPVKTECLAPGRWWATSGSWFGRGPTEWLAIMQLLETVQPE